MQATLKAVLIEVQRINQAADAAIIRDPWAQPYRINEDAAKRLVRACSQAHVQRLPADATPDDKTQARAQGPSDALAILSLRVLETAGQYRADKQASEWKDARHRRRQQQAARDREASRRRLAPGQRIDQALAWLSTTSTVTASRLDSDIVTGSKNHDSEPVVDDPLWKARLIADRAVRDIENEVEDAKRRRVELEAA